MYQIKLERFEGPLDLLLQLIEKEELNIAEISLSKVTEEYLLYLEKQADLPIAEMADFLVVAAKLLLIKSRVLLPQLFAEEEEEAEDLTRQLAIYKLYLNAGTFIVKRLQGRHFAYARERLPKSETVTFSPPSSLTTEAMKKSFENLLNQLKSFVKPAPELITRTLSLRERITKLRSLFTNASQLNFHQILADTTTRTEVIITFLALLELVKQKHVMARQASDSEQIIVTKLVEARVPMET